jgi:hypothetical protein
VLAHGGDISTETSASAQDAGLSMRKDALQAMLYAVTNCVSSSHTVCENATTLFV